MDFSGPWGGQRNIDPRGPGHVVLFANFVLVNLSVAFKEPFLCATHELMMPMTRGAPDTSCSLATLDPGVGSRLLCTPSATTIPAVDQQHHQLWMAGRGLPRGRGLQRPLPLPADAANSCPIYVAPYTSPAYVYSQPVTCAVPGSGGDLVQLSDVLLSHAERAIHAQHALALHEAARATHLQARQFSFELPHAPSVGTPYYQLVTPGLLNTTQNHLRSLANPTAPITKVKHVARPSATPTSVSLPVDIMCAPLSSRHDLLAARPLAPTRNRREVPFAQTARCTIILGAVVNNVLSLS